MSRATRLTVDQVRAIDHFAESLFIMFPHQLGVTICGSSLERDDYRDVDIRVILENNHYQALSDHLDIDDLNALLSRWGQQVTGLPIDCQLQPQSVHQTEAYGDNGEPRHHWRGHGRLGDTARRKPYPQASASTPENVDSPTGSDP